VGGAWRGITDFLELQPDGTYKVAVTKVARLARPSPYLQLCFYTEQVASIQGREPKLMHAAAGAA
jgi:hypothetical protein